MTARTALDLEDVLHGRARLAILAFLSSAGASDFTLLRDHTGLTDGNLSTHVRKLEEAGYVEIVKTFVGRRPRTTIHVTGRGRSAFDTYLEDLQQIILAARGLEGAAKDDRGE